MAYQILYHKVLFIQYIIFDFIFNKTSEEIDLATEEGQQRYVTIFGNKKFKNLIRIYSIEKLIIQHGQDYILPTSLIHTLFQNLNERSRRLVTAFISLTMNKKEKSNFYKLFKIDPKTVRKGIKELINGSILGKNKIRRKGGGRKSKTQIYDNFPEILETLTEDHLAGDPMNGRRWLRKNLVYFKDQLKALGIKASAPTIKKYFRKLKISLKVNNKSINNKQHKDRDSQFKQINRLKRSFLKSGNPVISIDTKKKEQIGQFKNQGKVWKKTAIDVFDHDFKNLSLGKAIPFGIYDVKLNNGYIYCGKFHETSQFIVEMIVKWWKEVGQFEYKNKKNLLILCDAGGANGYRRHGWKIELQNLLSSSFGLKVTVCHYPPGTSKWNPIEHRLFSHISNNWMGQPLNSYEKMLSFINTTTTKTGLTVKGYLVEKEYKTKIKYSLDQKRQLNILYMKKLPNWNYTLSP